MAASLWHLQQKKERLKREINEALDFVSGSITSHGKNGGFVLTHKVKTVTKSRYIRVGMLSEVRRMTKNNKKLKRLLKELSDLNWEIIKLSHGS